MNVRVLALLILVVLPGAVFTSISSFYPVPEWATLTASHQPYQALATSGASQRKLTIAQAAENRYRLNYFAEGVGVLLGSIIFAIGIHIGIYGICTLPQRTP